MWKLIEVLVSGCLSSVSWSGILMLGNLAQQCNTYLQCVHAWYECEYAHIVAFAMSYSLV